MQRPRWCSSVALLSPPYATYLSHHSLFPIPSSLHTHTHTHTHAHTHTRTQTHTHTHSHTTLPLLAATSAMSDGPSAKKAKDGESWRIDSWRSFPIKQQPQYPDQAKLKAVIDDLRSGGGRAGPPSDRATERKRRRKRERETKRRTSHWRNCPIFVPFPAAASALRPWRYRQHSVTPHPTEASLC